MFHSIKDSWLSASRNNMADVKELVPEFFYLPDFLLNTNKFDLGKKQNGLALNDVILPAWSKNDCREFIRIHRMVEKQKVQFENFIQNFRCFLGIRK